MRKIISLAHNSRATVVVWTIAAHVKSNSAHLQATEASTPASPHDISVKQGNSVPVEYFPHPF